MTNNMDSYVPLTDEELAAMHKSYAKTTPGPWYAHATDDAVFMNARYVSTEPGDFVHDNKRGMHVGEDAPDSERVIAITLLQMPRLADPDECDENTLFIAQARTMVPRLLSEVEYWKSIVLATQ